MKSDADSPMAIPLWINGRAFLTVTEEYVDVRNPDSGEVVRRTPLAGAAEVEEAVAAAHSVLPVWQSFARVDREHLLGEMGKLLDQYTGHFARLIREEVGGVEGEAERQVADAVNALRSNDCEAFAGVAALIVDASVPLSAIAVSLGKLLRCGATVVVKPSPKAPGAIFALVELSARAGLPPGVVNLVQGDLAAVEALLAHECVGRVEVAGLPAFFEQLGSLAAHHARDLTLNS